ncbi:DHHC palmitoyltransferase-domain-containing protein [Globomyces pollinis-pini]|nr:DHHC palmitoyltransferase-domain-containing protein [Globomyces pollinis-pini]
MLPHNAIRLLVLALLLFPVLMYQLLKSWTSLYPYFIWWISYILTVINYTLCLNTNPGFINNPSSLSSNPSPFTKDFHESNYCRFCDADKPKRAHHCKRCKTCIERMDHHCTWIDGCVGYHNQGHFVRLLMAGSILCLYSLGLLVVYLYYAITQSNGQNTENDFPIFIWGLLFIVLIPVTSIVVFLTKNQLFLMIRNSTTIENLEQLEDQEMGLDVSNPYDIGWLGNTKQILGDIIFLWWLPQPMPDLGSMKYRKLSVDHSSEGGTPYSATTFVSHEPPHDL